MLFNFFCFSFIDYSSLPFFPPSNTSVFEDRTNSRPGSGGFEEPKWQIHFQIFTHLSWLAEPIIPVIGDCDKADITHLWATMVIHLFSVTFQSSNDWIAMKPERRKKGKRNKGISNHQVQVAVVWNFNLKRFSIKCGMYQKKNSK